MVFLGTIYPAITEIFTGQQVGLGASFFNRAFTPLAWALIMLFGICPVLMWQRSSLGRIGRRLLVPAVLALVVMVAGPVL